MFSIVESVCSELLEMAIIAVLARVWRWSPCTLRDVMRSHVRGTARNVDDRRGLGPAGWHGAFPAHVLTAADVAASGLGGQLVECGAWYSYAHTGHPLILQR